MASTSEQSGAAANCTSDGSPILRNSLSKLRLSALSASAAAASFAAVAAVVVAARRVARRFCCGKEGTRTPRTACWLRALLQGFPQQIIRELASGANALAHEAKMNAAARLCSDIVLLKEQQALTLLQCLML